MNDLSEVVESYMERTEGLKRFCDRCLNTERYGGNVVLMVVDAAFDSIGLDYFNSIVPKVLEFKERFVEDGSVQSLEDLGNLPHGQVEDLWANERSWNVATSVASHLHELGEGRGLNDRQALRTWARNADLENWNEILMGKISVSFWIALSVHSILFAPTQFIFPDEKIRKNASESEGL